MKLAAVVVALALAGCASYDGRGLVAGSASAADVEALMGPAAERRTVANGETWLYYPRQPFGRAMYVARIAPDGRLIAIEQRLTDENIARIRIGETRREQVAELLGPPYLVTNFPRLQRDVWEYHIRRWGNPGLPGALYIQFSPDGVAREVMFQDEPESWLVRGASTEIGVGAGVRAGAGLGF